MYLFMFACDLKNLFEWKQKQNVELNTEITVKQIAHKFLSKSVGLNEWNYDFYARTTQNAEIECKYTCSNWVVEAIGAPR